VQEPTYYILLALLGDRLHGYAIASRVRELSEDRLRLTAGTLYGALDRLVDKELVRVDGEEQVQGRRRRYYRIVYAGRAALLAEVERMRSSVAAADGLIEPTGWEVTP
jgi:DNA-binding PadR family transcriptional regulator